MSVDKKTLERRIIFKAIREPNFLDNLKKNRVDLFKDNEELATIYSSLKEYYTENPEKGPSKDVLASYVNSKLDRQGVAENDRYDLMDTLNQVYDYSEEDQKVYDSKISDYIKREQLLKSIKTMVANEMTPESIDKFERDYNKIQLTSKWTYQDGLSGLNGNWGNNDAYAIAWNSSIFCVAGDKGRVATSPDGVTWTVQSGLQNTTWGWMNIADIS